MAWAGSITARGEAGQSGTTSSLSSNTFTPAAGSVVVAVVGESAAITSAGDISGHDSGGAWVEIGSATISGRVLHLFAAHPGGSPSSGTITLASEYAWRRVVRFYEITDVYTDGTVAASFGTPGTDTASGGAPTLSMSLAAFANSEGLTFVAAMSYSATSGMTFETSPSYTELADGTPGGVSIQLAEAYYGGEDNTVDVAMTGYTQHAGIAVEMVGIAAGGGVVTFRRRLED